MNMNLGEALKKCRERAEALRDKLGPPAQDAKDALRAAEEALKVVMEENANLRHLLAGKVREPVAWAFYNPDNTLRFILSDWKRVQAWQTAHEGKIVPLYLAEQA